VKVAICFSGHLRNFSNLLENFKEKILSLRKDHQVDVFFSIWDIYEPQYSWTNENETISNLIDTEDLSELYSIKIEVENFNEIKEQFLLKNFTTEGLNEGHNRLIKDGILHSTPMFYKIYKANELKKDYEKINNFKYDIAIRYRSNLLINGNIDLNINKNILYNKRENNSNLDDIFAYSDSETMDKYSDLYLNLSLILNKYRRFGPEEILYDWIINENKIPRKDTSFSIDIIR
jgi:hypothetical protein